MSEYRIPLGYVRGPAGTAGKNFEFKKTYTSVSAMNADFSGTDTSTGDYVLIAATSADDSDNGRLYRKGESTWIYVARINGPTGAQGQRGPMPPLVTDLNVTLPGEGALDASVGPRIAERLIANGGDAAENMVTFTSSDTDDSSAITGYETMPVFEKGQSGSENRLKTLFATMSKAVKNIRYLIKLMGSTDISGISSGTVTSILSALNSGKLDKANVVNNLTTQNSGYALDARQGRALSTSISSLNDALKKFHVTSSNASALAEFDLTSGGSYVTRYYTAYNSASDNYGRQLVCTGTAIRYDVITNGGVTTLWTIIDTRPYVKTVTVTLSAYGQASLGMASSAYVIASAISSNRTVQLMTEAVSPYNYWVIVRDASGNLVTNTSISVTLLYYTAAQTQQGS